MYINQEFVNKVAPTHGRMSCSDSNHSNAYGGWNGKFDPDTGEKVIRYPRCTRCYLLDHLGCDTNDLEFEIVYVQPELRYKRTK